MKITFDNGQSIQLQENGDVIINTHLVKPEVTSKESPWDDEATQKYLQLMEDGKYFDIMKLEILSSEEIREVMGDSYHYFQNYNGNGTNPLAIQSAINMLAQLPYLVVKGGYETETKQLSPHACEIIQTGIWILENIESKFPQLTPLCRTTLEAINGGFTERLIRQAVNNEPLQVWIELYSAFVSRTKGDRWKLPFGRVVGLVGDFITRHEEVKETETKQLGKENFIEPINVSAVKEPPSSEYRKRIKQILKSVRGLLFHDAAPKMTEALIDLLFVKPLPPLDNELESRIVASTTDLLNQYRMSMFMNSQGVNETQRTLDCHLKNTHAFFTAFSEKINPFNREVPFPELDLSKDRHEQLRFCIAKYIAEFMTGALPDVCNKDEQVFLKDVVENVFKKYQVVNPFDSEGDK